MEPADATGRSLTGSGRLAVAEPFSWDQTMVLREGGTYARRIDGYDPQYNRVGVEVDVKTFQLLSVGSYDKERGWLFLQAPGKGGGKSETATFQVFAGGVTASESQLLTCIVKRGNEVVRATPFLMRSAGDAVAPGRIVHFQWTRAGTNEVAPKWEALLRGRSGAADGLRETRYTDLRGLKVRPAVLGYHILTVTPRDAADEPPRGSMSNGHVFLCAWGNENLPPITDGLLADDFTPAVGQIVAMRPSVVDPETGRSVFTSADWDFGDGAAVNGIDGATSHAFSAPGIYRVRCTVADEYGASATAEDNFIVGTVIKTTSVALNLTKQVRVEEGGVGEPDKDRVSVRWPGVSAGEGDRILFAFNRNRWGRSHASDGDGPDIVLNAAGRYDGKLGRLGAVSVAASGGGLHVNISGVSLDRTGDPRLGGVEKKGAFDGQRLALCVIPADGSTARVFLFDGKIRVRVKGGQSETGRYIPEQIVRGTIVR